MQLPVKIREDKISFSLKYITRVLLRTLLILFLFWFQKSLTTWWCSYRPTESKIHSKNIQSRRSPKNELFNHGHGQESVHRRSERFGEPIRSSVIRWFIGKYLTAIGRYPKFEMVWYWPWFREKRRWKVTATPQYGTSSWYSRKCSLPCAKE